MSDAPTTTTLGMYYAASRLRSDNWDRLHSLAKLLHAQATREEDVAGCVREIELLFVKLRPLESYWAFPGIRAVAMLEELLADGGYEELAASIAWISRVLVSDGFRSESGGANRQDILRGRLSRSTERDAEPSDSDPRPYFAVMVVDELTAEDEDTLRESLWTLRRDEDEFVYEIVVVPSFEDAVIAALLNYNIQAAVIRYDFPLRSQNRLEMITARMAQLEQSALDLAMGDVASVALGGILAELRPTIDLYLVTRRPVEEVAGTLGRRFRRVFYREEDHVELHMSILKGLRARYQTPFFSALKAYSQKPTGVFHALPISRSKSITKSHWIGDMLKFYGASVFLAETSATTAGLDSLSQPTGTLARAQELAARAFGARRSFFVTNGTSTANKIVTQAMLHPGDIVLLSRDCHKSHHYSLVLLGARPVYMDPYPLRAHGMYGGVPIREIKRQLLSLKRAGQLANVKLLLLTNCTFDGVVYDVRRVMEEVLAIKPDIMFLWDEAWFAFAYFAPIPRQRTAMGAARSLRSALNSDDHRARYARWKAEFDALDPDDDATWLDNRLMADPSAASVCVYATQSTHKTLTAMRQGSMIHVFDDSFEHDMEESFHEALMTHTSTSPSYQILASLDVGRRQVELEGYELVQHAIELAVLVRERINTSSLLSRYFRVLSPEEMIPAEFRPSGFTGYHELRTDWAKLDEAFSNDEFVLEPTRLTLAVGQTGLDGEQLKRLLIEEHDIQINKTTKNTILLLTHIGTTRGAVAHLLEVLTSIATSIDETRSLENSLDAKLRVKRVAALTERQPPLPNFSRFHDVFRQGASPDTLEGDLRRAFFLAGDEAKVEYIDLVQVPNVMAAGREVVAATFVTPYPPGFPVLVPGQTVTDDIVDYLLGIATDEIHGYSPDYGLRVFTEVALADALASPS